MYACIESFTLFHRSRFVRLALAVVCVAAFGWFIPGRVAAQDASPAPAADTDVLYDDFADDALDPARWEVIAKGSGPTLAETNQQLEITIPANATGAVFYAGYRSKCYLGGDFDIQVDYRLLTWPASNGVRLGLQTGKTIERVSRSADDEEPRGEVYAVDFLEDGVAFAPTADQNGTLRLTRTGATLTAYYGSAGAPTSLYAGSVTSADIRFTIFAWSHDQFFANQTAKIAFDDMRVNQGRLICPTQPDLLVESVMPVQVIENQPLVVQKATGVKAVIRKNGGAALANVTAQLTYGARTMSTFYVADAANLDAQYVLSATNAVYPLDFAADENTKTVYFFSDQLSPTMTGNYTVTVAVDSSHQIDEIDESNNVYTGTTTIVATDWGIPLDLRLGFFRVDWGNTPVATFDRYVTGSSDFVHAVFPVTDPEFSTSSASFSGFTAPFRGPDDRLDEREFYDWVIQMIILFRHADLETDRFVAVAPAGWFAAHTTLPDAVGATYREIPEMTVQEARLTTVQGIGKTVAHELGHTYGLRLACEEYNGDCNLTIKHDIGNLAANGLWVARRVPILSIEAVRNVYCFMGGFSTAAEYWVDAEDYAAMLNTRTSLPPVTAQDTGQSLLTTGILHVDGTVTLHDWYTLPKAELSPLTPGPYTFEFQDATGAVMAQVTFTATFALEGEPLTEAPFVLTLPYVAGTTRVAIKLHGETKAEKVVSSHAPTVTITAPNGGELVGGQTTIRWASQDTDGDALHYLLLLSKDDGSTWEPLTGNLTTTSFVWELNEVQPGSGYRVKVVATDGFNTANDRSDAAFTVAYQLYTPLITR